MASSTGACVSQAIRSEDGEPAAKIDSPRLPPRLNLTGIACPELTAFTNGRLEMGWKKPLNGYSTRYVPVACDWRPTRSTAVTVADRVAGATVTVVVSIPLAVHDATPEPASEQLKNEKLLVWPSVTMPGEANAIAGAVTSIGTVVDPEDPSLPVNATRWTPVPPTLKGAA